MQYAWHQPAKYVDYDVKLTDTITGDFTGPQQKDEAILKMEDAWLGCCVVWWSLLLRGVLADLLLWRSTTAIWARKTGLAEAMTKLKHWKWRMDNRILTATVRFRQTHCRHDFSDDAKRLSYCDKCGINKYQTEPIDYDLDPDEVPF